MPARRTFANLAAALLAAATLLSACGGAAAAPAPTSAPPTPVPTEAPPPPPTATPAPTAVPTLARGVFVAGVDVSGRTPAEARAALERRLAPLLRPLEVRAGPATLTLRPDDIGLQVDYDGMIGAALAAGAGTRVPLNLIYDREKLRALVEGLAPRADAAPQVSVLTGTQPISRSFALSGGQSLDVDAAVQRVDERLWQLGAARRVTLPLTTPPEARPTPAQLQEQLEAMVEEWDGVAGVYVYDLASGQEVASVHKNTVFSTASTIKTPIMLNTYASANRMSDRTARAMRRMIIDSDNLAANTVMAASVGGTGTEEAIAGAEQMSAMMADLGLANTYQYVAFEAADYIRLYNIKIKAGPRDPVGEPPYTQSGRYQRTTPAEMAQVYVFIEQCSRGEGVLLEKYPETLTAARCQEMIDLLKQNADTKRMVAGLPPGTEVAHKSGWISNMQADAGIVRSPGGDYIVSIFLYRDGPPVPDRVMMQSIAGFSRLVYTYYNPVAAPR